MESVIEYYDGQVLKDEKRNITILKTKTDKKGKNMMLCKCNNDGYEWYSEKYNIYQGKGCPCCSKPIKKIVLGINTIWDTDRWMVDDFGLDEEFAKIHTYGSAAKAEVTCPNCGKKKIMSVCKLKEYRYVTCTCRDSVSYPEKLIHSLLKQLKVDFIAQLNKTTYTWCDKYKYDFYIPKCNMIIETHGKQHYVDSGWGKAKDIQCNDIVKKELAINNGISNYIAIDCKYSDLEYIKNNILNSKLAELFDLSNINWNKCEEFALGSLVKLACNIYNEHPDYTTGDIGEILGYTYPTIKRWLTIGTRHNLTHYDPIQAKVNANRKIQRNKKRKVVLV